jgi:hypothetical protein
VTRKGNRSGRGGKGGTNEINKTKTKQVKETKIMKKLTILLVAMALLGLVGAGMAQSDDHEVRIVIADTHVLSVAGTPTLTIDTATPGQDLDDSNTDNSTVLTWTSNAAVGARQITVQALDAIPANVTLSVNANNLNQDGGSNPGPTLGSVAAIRSTDSDPIVTSAGKFYGWCNLEYQASATVDATVTAGVDITVQYTIEP